MADICKGMRAYFAAKTDVAALVNSTVAGSTTAIYPDELRQRSPMPAVVMTLLSAVGNHHFGGSAALVRSLVQTDCYAETRLGATALAEALRLAADGYRGAMGGETVRCCHVVGRRWLYDAPQDKSDLGRYRLALDWLVWHTESAPHLGST